MKAAFLYIFLALITVTSYAEESLAIIPVEQTAITTCSIESLPVLESSATSSGFFSNILDTSLWPARWYCGVWTDFHGWMYISSDLMIWAAYFLIPLILGYFLYKRRKEVPFHSILFLFIAFILACGITHLVDAAIFWWPAYKLSAVVRMGTALISWGTVFALVKVTPKLMDFKSPATLEKIVAEKTAELQALNQKLHKEIEEKNLAQQKLKQLNDELEEVVEKRTDSLIKAKNKLEYLNSLFKAVQEAANIGVWEVDLEKDDIYWSDKVYDIHEVPRGSDINLESAIDFYHDDYKSEIAEAVETAINEGKSWDKKLKLITASKREIWVHAIGIPFVHEGKTVKLRGLFQDIDKSEKDQHLIRENESNLFAIIENTESPIWSINNKYELTVFNTAFESIIENKYRDKPQIGDMILDDGNPEELNAYWKEKYDKVLSSKEKLIWLEEDQSAGTFTEVSLSPILDENEGVIGISGLARDITVAKKQEEMMIEINQSLEAKVEERTKELSENNIKLASINKELESFSYSVSHDLRSPLRGIYGFTNAIKEDYEHLLDEDGKDYLDRVLKGVSRMGALIDDLLTLSRVSRKPVDKKELDLSQLVKETFDLLEKGNTTINIEKGVKAYGDINLLGNALQNLLENGIKYSSKIANPHIEFGTKTEDGKTIYYISDNGAGFDMRYVDKLFGPFQRLHSNEDFKGNGIGLATVKRIILKHGGEVWAESVESKGSTFYFTLG
ncbi:PAS domain-containing protein [Fulvivirga sp. RKSG066]|uniref:ATP-binding protein n=1 Tax=Fulvivirga aurantia TaxID=2529383 RepID=UPI0012BBB9EF|nr:ATP-binding protein [Fulvivirga aurantia]MTI21147.1 PAS domain-containing protein [Fulvivirga aurantia]